MIADLYCHEGKRLDYWELPKEMKARVKAEKKRITKELFNILKNRRVNQVIDYEQPIEICFTKKGVDHFCNDAMLSLSGKYFDEDEMKRIDEYLSRAKYISTSHKKFHDRNDGRDLWFAYKDAEGDGIYFKVCWNKNITQYEFYTIEKELKVIGTAKTHT